MTFKAKRVALYCGVAIAALLSATAALGQSVNFDVPSDAAVNSIPEFARQAGIQIVAPSDELGGVRTHAVKGNKELHAALEELLAGTSLEIASENGQTVMLRVRSKNVEAASNSGAANTLALSTETVVVTGSHIDDAHPSASTTFVLTRKDIDESGATTVQQLIRNLPQNFVGGANEWTAAVSSTRNGGDQNPGYGSGINLRGLGNSATLVLLNGQRVAPGGLGGFVDVSTIPLSALERIDVVADGASAIYGSDAVAGVVNFVLRPDYDGVEATARYSQVTEGHLKEAGGDILAGTSWAGGSGMIVVDYNNRSSLLASDRGYASPLAVGPTDLVPTENKVSVLANGNQSLLPALRSTLTAYYNDRHSNEDFIDPNFLQQTFSRTNTQQWGGTVGLEWAPVDDWKISLDQTVSETDTNRKNHSLTSPILPDILPESRNALSYDFSTYSTDLLAEGSLFTTPIGEIKAAVGGEYRLEDMGIARSGFGEPGTQKVDIDRSIWAAFAEIHAPLFVDDQGNAKLDISAAIRYEHYSDFGSTTNPKLGVVWSPVADFSVRGSLGTSFRAPYLSQLDNSLEGGLIEDVINPASPTGLTTLATVFNAPGPHLGPEKATTWSAGIDIGPDWLYGAKVSASYFDVSYRDRIASFSGSDGAFTDPTVAQLVSVPPNPSIISAIEALPPTRVFNFSSGTLADVTATFEERLINVASTNVKGLDFSASRSIDSDYGTFDLGVNASYLFQFKNKFSPSTAPVETVSTVFNPVDFRARANLGWNFDSWSTALFINYVDNYTDNQASTPIAIPAWTTVDLSLAYAFGESSDLNGFVARLNVINLFDTSPPLVTDLDASYASPGFDTENANPLGRVIGVTFTKIF